MVIELTELGVAIFFAVEYGVREGILNNQVI